MEYIEELDGVGIKKSELFHKLGVYTIHDLISYYPRKYNYLKRTNMRQVMHGDKVIIDGRVESQPTMGQASRGVLKIMFRFANEEGVYHILVYNQVYLLKNLKVGMPVIVIGKYDRFKRMIVASEIRRGKLSLTGEIEPVYSATGNLSSKVIERTIQLGLNSRIEIVDYIPKSFSLKYHFPEKLWAIREIHHPTDAYSYRRSKQRLKYEELFWYLFRVRALANVVSDYESNVVKVFDEALVDKFIQGLDFELTPDQLKVVREIEEDLRSSKRMNRLVQGDVGSGKTIVAFISSYINYLSGYQTAFMVPTEILANQHYQNALSLFKNTKMRVGLLTSSVVKRDKEKILLELASGQLDLIIGTHALIQEKVEYANLGLIIADEQHRFGVNQRNELKKKGLFPDILSMSATPIPRTYALTIYGDMDVSNIRTKPASRKEVITYYKNESQLMEVLGLMKKELDLGHQIYVIAPAISGENEIEWDNVIKLKEKMRLAFGRKYLVEAVHGKMLSDEKIKIMKDFEEGVVQLLIATAVIEVGVNVPNASMIVIFNANLFGLSTLHQLRGRVGRGSIQSYCILVSKVNSERLEMLTHTTDGFQISEYDFKMRGEGDLFGTRQSGEIELKLANVIQDFDLLVRVKEDVDELFSDDFLKEENLRLLELFNRKNN